MTSLLTPTVPVSVPAKEPRAQPKRRWKVLGIVALVMLTNACTLHSGTDYKFVDECCYRDVLVLSRGQTRTISDGIHNVAQNPPYIVASVIAGEIAKYPALDYFTCPSASLCTTTSEYVRGHPSDLYDARNNANRDVNCLSLQVWDHYNWSNRSADCIRN